MLTKRFSRLVRFHFLKMFMGVLNRAILYDQLGGSLLSHPRNSRDIICGVPHQSFQFNDLRRRDLIFLQHLLCMEVLNRRFAPGSLGKTDHDPVCRKLEKISVS